MSNEMKLGSYDAMICVFVVAIIGCSSNPREEVDRVVSIQRAMVNCQYAFKLTSWPKSDDEMSIARFKYSSNNFQAWRGRDLIVASWSSRSNPSRNLDEKKDRQEHSLDPRQYDAIHFAGERYAASVTRSADDSFVLSGLYPVGQIPNMGLSLREIFAPQLFVDYALKSFPSKEMKKVFLHGVPALELSADVIKITTPDSPDSFEQHRLYFDPSTYHCVGRKVHYSSSANLEGGSDDEYSVEYQMSKNVRAPIKISRVYSGANNFQAEMQIGAFSTTPPASDFFELGYYGIPEPDVTSSGFSIWFVLLIAGGIVLFLALSQRRKKIGLSVKPSTSGEQRGAFTLVELVVSMSILVILIGLLLPAVQSARESARKMICTNNLRNLSLAALNAEAASGRLPGPTMNDHPQSGNYHSDMGLFVVLLPYLDHMDQFQRLDLSQTCHSLKNAPLLRFRPSILKCPSSGESELLNAMASVFSGPGVDEVKGVTCDYVGNHGVIYMNKPPALGAIRVRIGNFAREHRMKEIVDGTSQTFLFWECSGDGLWSASRFRSPFDTQCPLSFQYLVDGAPSRTLYSTTQASTKSYLVAWSGFRAGSIHYDDSKQINETNRYNQPFSSHVGQLPTSNVDGSTHFISFGIEKNVLASLATSREGDTVTEYD